MQVPVGGSAKLDDRKQWAAAVAERCADEVRKSPCVHDRV